MKKLLLALLLVPAFVLCRANFLSAQEYEQSYHYYMVLGIKAYDKGFYRKAIFYFESAHSIEPSQITPLRYIKLTKRSLDQKLALVETQQLNVTAKAKEFSQNDVIHPDNNKSKKFTKTNSSKKHLDIQNPKIILDDRLWSRQPNTELNIELQKNYSIQGQNIRQYLVVAEEFLGIERVDKNLINITTSKRGETFLYVWDDKGRWTFHVRGVLPEKKLSASLNESLVLGQESENPFKIAYANDWNSFYVGNTIPGMKRRNLVFTQWIGTYGTTPYGEIDASVNYYKFPEKTERIGQRIGLVNGKVGDFKDFSIRGYDTEAYFSDLTLPGRSFRGAKLDAYAFDHNLKYTVIQGQDRAQYLFLSPGAFDVRKSYLEGISTTIFPEGDHQYKLNYVRGYGEAREEILKERVYSAETLHRYGDFEVSGEVGYDEDVVSELVRTELKKDNYGVNINFRDIDKDYVDIVSRPAGRGEVGGNVRYYFSEEQARVNTNLDIFRDRFLFNPDNNNSLNLQWDGSYNYRLTESSDWNTSAFANYTPQLISPNTGFSLTNRYSKNFPWFKMQTFSTFVGHTTQIARYEKSPASEFDRQSLMTGFRMPLVKNMSYYLNYEYSWVTDIFLDEINTPQVMTTGIDYYLNLTNALTWDMGLRYQDEQNSEGNFSFLSGEDYLRGTLGLTYQPTRELEIYLDANIRDVWAEDSDAIAFDEADVRCGVRSSWDTFFHWNPTGIVEGTVYNDLNGNNKLDPDETGLSDIGVKVGNKVLKTNNVGRYSTKVKAKKVLVMLDVSHLPRGFLNSGDYSYNIDIEHNKTRIINFGLTNQSGVYGVVFIDRNQNGKIDKGELPVTKTKITLDNTITDISDAEGSYSFDNVNPGRHTVRLDINSLPVNYIPRIKLENTIEVGEGITYILNFPLTVK